MNGWIGRLLTVLVCAVLASLFTWLNAGQVVTVRLGFVTLRSVSLPAVIFGSILFGMGLVFLAGLRADLRTRRMLERYREALGRVSGVTSQEDPPDPR